MPKCKRLPIHNDPDVLTAVAEYRRQGLPPADIMRRLRVSQRTYYRCLESIESLRQEAGVDHDDD